MALANYADLVSAVGAWLDRDDLAARVPDFITLSEARLNRLLDDPDMEVVSEVSASGEYTGLPSDFGQMVSITTGTGALQPMGSAEYAGLNHSITGIPRFYSIIDNSIALAPGNASANIRMVYRRSIPPLTADNNTNWLLNRAPDVYLYGALVQASAFLIEDDRIGLWKAAFDEAIGELRMDGMRRKWGVGPVAPRIRRA